MRITFGCLFFTFLSSCSVAGNAPRIPKSAGLQNKNGASERKSRPGTSTNKRDTAQKIESGEKLSAEKIIGNENGTQKESAVQKGAVLPENGIKPRPSGEVSQVNAPATHQSVGGQQLPNVMGNVPQVVNEAGYQIHLLENEVMNVVNEYRKSKGLSILVPHTRAFMQSRVHSENIKNGLYPMGHEGFTDRLRIIVKAVPGGTILASAENVAPSGGKDAAAAALRGWLGSPGHRSNIEGDFTHTGTGMAQFASGNYVLTQIFLKL